MNVELFSVEKGDNKGVYLKVTNQIPESEQRKILGRDGFGAGIINVNNGMNFYIRYGAATNQSLQSMSTFNQVATIWRLNPYGMNNKATLKYCIDKIYSAIDLLNEHVKYNVRLNA